MAPRLITEPSTATPTPRPGCQSPITRISIEPGPTSCCRAVAEVCANRLLHLGEVPAADFDVVILGGGMGGYPAAIRASQLGLKVALVEADKLGGTCLHIGCIPTKALLESSELYHRVSARGSEFGLKAEVVGYDFPRISARRDE